MDPAMNSAVEEQAIDRWVYFDRHLGLSQKHPSIFVRPSRIHRIGQTKQVFVKRLIIKDSIEERILETRRSLAADGPKTSTHLDGTGLLEEKGFLRPGRHEDHAYMGEKTFQRLRMLESLFGFSTNTNATKAWPSCLPSTPFPSGLHTTTTNNYPLEWTSSI